MIFKVHADYNHSVYLWVYDTKHGKFAIILCYYLNFLLCPETDFLLWVPIVRVNKTCVINFSGFIHLISAVVLYQIDSNFIKTIKKMSYNWGNKYVYGLFFLTREWKPLSSPQNAVSLQSAESVMFQKADSLMPFCSLLRLLMLPLFFVSGSKTLEKSFLFKPIQSG